jgi:hypothetical protein
MEMVYDMYDEMVSTMILLEHRARHTRRCIKCKAYVRCQCSLHYIQSSLFTKLPHSIDASEYPPQLGW